MSPPSLPFAEMRVKNTVSSFSYFGSALGTLITLDPATTWAWLSAYRNDNIRWQLENSEIRKCLVDESTSVTEAAAATVTNLFCFTSICRRRRRAFSHYGYDSVLNFYHKIFKRINEISVELKFVFIFIFPFSESALYFVRLQPHRSHRLSAVTYISLHLSLSLTLIVVVIVVVVISNHLKIYFYFVDM